MRSGRPKIITSKIVQKLEQAFREGFSIQKACELSGVGRSTYYDYLDKNQSFSDKMTLAQQWPTEVAKKNIVQAIKRGDISASKWWLERKAKDEFGTKTFQQTESSNAALLETQLKLRSFFDDLSDIPEPVITKRV